jgi:hypothetical protein
MICDVYALDSPTGRTSKLICQRGLDACAAEIDLTRRIGARGVDRRPLATPGPGEEPHAARDQLSRERRDVPHTVL